LIDKKLEKRMLMNMIPMVIVFNMIILIMIGCKQDNDHLVVYTSVDRVYSEEVFKLFTEETGIEVKAVYDVEATKTTGLVNRLISEKDKPVADVFWNGEIIYTLRLKEENVLAPYKSENSQGLPDQFVDSEFMWTAFGGRARVFIVNKDLIDRSDIEPSIYKMHLQAEEYSIGLAKPMFGTTATHVAGIYAIKGQDETYNLFKQIDESNVNIVDGNGAVRDMVVSGQLDFGLTDTDDALSAVNKGAMVDLVFPDQEDDECGTLIIPNSVALIQGCDNSEEGKLFIDFLLEKDTIEYMISIGWIQIAYKDDLLIDENLKPFLPEDGDLKIMQVSFEEIVEKLMESSEDMKDLFLD